MSVRAVWWRQGCRAPFIRMVGTSGAKYTLYPAFFRAADSASCEEDLPPQGPPVRQTRYTNCAAPSPYFLLSSAAWSALPRLCSSLLKPWTTWPAGSMAGSALGWYPAVGLSVAALDAPQPIVGALTARAAGRWARLGAPECRRQEMQRLARRP